jgi:hypothetical protein
MFIYYSRLNVLYLTLLAFELLIAETKERIQQVMSIPQDHFLISVLIDQI